MELLTNVGSFVNGPEFFFYHGYGLTFLWIAASTIAILAKKINVYLHAILFFLIDVSTLFLVVGAIYRYLPKFATFQQWGLVKQLHIFGGILVLLMIIIQHIGGVKALLSKSQKDPLHKKFAFWVSNAARLIVCLGWLMKGDQANLLYVGVSSLVLLIASFYNSFLVKKYQEKVNPQESKTKTKSA